MPSDALIKTGPEPRDYGNVMFAWQRFLSGEDVPQDAIRHLIQDSWNRCLDEGVDPFRDRARINLGDDGLHALQDGAHHLIHASKSVMAEAESFLSESGTVMLVTDPTGVVLHMAGDRSAVASGEEILLSNGANWSESSVGTNAIGTALSAGKPVQIHAAEHFCEGIKEWTCSATVIRDPRDDKILGAVDISGLSSTFNQHSLALVVAAASRIEGRLLRSGLETRYRLLDTVFSRFSNGSRDGMLAFDPQGRLVKANEYAPSALAARGIKFPLGNRTRIEALADPVASPDEVAREVEWIRPEWIERITAGGEDLGTLVVIPMLGKSLSVIPAAQPGQRSRRSISTLRPAAFETLRGGSPVYADTIEKARRLAKVAVPVLLEGGVGAGKEALARSMHSASPLAEGPFVTVACGGISPELLITELFGYAKGSFSGSRRSGLAGKIEAADGGTLFVDEIDQMVPDLQSQFLRVLEVGEIYRLGEVRPRKARVRLIAATSRELSAEVEAGRFRMDLLCRISVTSLRVPELRERAKDIPALAEHFCKRYAFEHGVDVKTFEPGAMKYLMDYHWPGNVKELGNVVEQMLLTSEGDTLIASDVPLRVCDPHSTAATDGPVNTPMPAVQSLEAAEREAIVRAIEAADGNMTHAARHLEIAKSTLYLKLKKYELDR